MFPMNMKALVDLHLAIPFQQRRQWHSTPVLLPEVSPGWRSLEGCSPWGRWGSDTTEWLHFHFSLSCIGKGNGNPLQCSCLENPRDWGAWWAAVYGVTQSRTWLKQLSSSSSILFQKAYKESNVPQYVYSLAEQMGACLLDESRNHWKIVHPENNWDL